MAQTEAPSKARGGEARRGAVARRRRIRGAVAAAALAAGALAVAWLLQSADGESGAGQAGQPVERFMHIHGLALPPWAPDEVYVATHEGLIRIDAVGQWRFVSAEPHDFMGFSAHPADEDVFYSSGHPAPGARLRNPIGFMVSVDGGATWAPRSLEGAADFHAMAVAPSDGDVVYGWNGAGRAGLHVSGDAGASWDVISGGALGDAGGALSLAVRPGEPSEVWAGTQAGLLASSDGGRSWQALLAGAVTAVAFDPADPDRALAYAPDGQGLQETRDAGRTWTPLGLALDGDAVGHIAVHPEDPETVHVGTYGQDLLRTTDAGRTWETLASDGAPAG